MENSLFPIAGPIVIILIIWLALLILKATAPSDECDLGDYDPDPYDELAALRANGISEDAIREMCKQEGMTYRKP